MGIATLIGMAVAAAIAVPLAFANTATPTTSHSTWSYTSGTSGPVKVVVTGNWNWVTQSCASGGTVSSTDVKGHYAIGYAGSWNDSTTPNTLTGKATDGTPVTLHVGNTMDQVIVDFCKGTTTASPYPTGTFSISHTYPSLAAFQAAVPNGEVCVNAYDIHQQTQNNDWNPGKNGDNTLKANQYVTGAMCSTAAQAEQSPAISLIKYERFGKSDPYVRGPLTGTVGQTVNYEMIVRNTGNTPLDDVTLSDPRCDAGTLTPTSAVSLAPGASAAFYCSHKLTSSDRPEFVNTATVQAHNASASSSVNATSSVSASSQVTTALGAVKAVHHTAKPAKPVTKAASFTG
ncbi:MAG TPA: hypothetical protein VFA37_09195 [Gaiellaceae bacterium]|nr:hypothetical protein [Gaiellaceae bacterium]